MWCSRRSRCRKIEMARFLLPRTWEDSKKSTPNDINGRERERERKRKNHKKSTLNTTKRAEREARETTREEHKNRWSMP